MPSVLHMAPQCDDPLPQHTPHLSVNSVLQHTLQALSGILSFVRFMTAICVSRKAKVLVSMALWAALSCIPRRCGSPQSSSPLPQPHLGHGCAALACIGFSLGPKKKEGSETKFHSRSYAEKPGFFMKLFWTSSFILVLWEGRRGNILEHKSNFLSISNPGQFLPMRPAAHFAPGSVEVLANLTALAGCYPGTQLCIWSKWTARLASTSAVLR